MRRSKSITRVVSIVGCTLVLAACDSRKPLVLAWTSNEPAAEISQLLAQELNTDFVVTTRQFSDAGELTEAVEQGLVDVAIIEEPSQTNADLNVLRSLFPSVLHVLAKPTIEGGLVPTLSISEVVKAKNVYAGPPGGTGHQLVKMLIKQQIFPAENQFTLLESVFEAEPDIFIVFGGILSQDALQRLSAYRLISLGAVADFGRGSWAEGVALKTPSVQPFIIPEGLYPGIATKPTLSLSVQSLLVTHPGLNDQSAYAVLMRVEELMAQIRGIYPLAGRQTSQANEASFNLTTHPGALRYEQREAPGFLERYAELLAFIVTAILALSSLFIALLRMRKQARKDRIDVYFEQLLKLRSSVHDKAQANLDIPNEVIKLQHIVTQLVSDERIAADSAFVGFLELSNQVLKECSEQSNI